MGHTPKLEIAKQCENEAERQFHIARTTFDEATDAWLAAIKAEVNDELMKPTHEKSADVATRIMTSPRVKQTNRDVKDAVGALIAADSHLERATARVASLSCSN